MITEHALLELSNPNMSFVLQTDASDYGLGALRPVPFANHTLTQSASNFSVRLSVGARDACFRNYPLGQPVLPEVKPST